MPEPHPSEPHLPERHRFEPLGPEASVSRGRGDVAVADPRPRLDPRTAVVLTVLVSVAVMSPGGLRFVPGAILLGAALAVWEGAWRRGVVVLVAAAVVGFLGWVLPLWWTNPLTVFVALVSTYLIRFVAVAAVAAHLVATTSATRLSAALRAARAPREIAVPLGATLRFLPVVGAEAAAVRDALRLRGVLGGTTVLRHPLRAVEHFTVPLIAASLRAGDDLAASAILRGLGSRQRPTTMLPLRFAAPDLVVALAVVALAVLSFLAPAPLGG